MANELFDQTYNCYEHSPMGDRNATFSFKLQNGVLGGTFSPDPSTGIVDTPILDGSVDGNKFKFTVKWKQHVINYEGTISDEGFLDANANFIDGPRKGTVTPVSSEHLPDPEMPAGGPPPMGDPGGPGGMPPMGGPGGPGGMPPMGAKRPGSFIPEGVPMPGTPGGPPPMDSLADTAAIRTVSGKREGEYADGKVKIEVAAGAKGISDSQADGVKLTSGDYGAAGVVVAGNGTFTFGGKESYYEVDGKTYNSILNFSVDTPVEAGAKSGTGAAAGDNAVLILNNAHVSVDGAGRYATAAFDSARLVVNDSDVVGTGPCKNTDAIGEGRPNDKLLMYGHARTNFSVNQSKTYYYNSSCIAEGWAALSTDAARDDGLDLYAYQSYAEAINGGYATYADFTCRVKSYGSVLIGNEMGAIISKSGEVHLYDNLDATENDALAYAKACGAKIGTERIHSQMIGGRNAIMIHAPDMMNEGIAATDTATVVVKGALLKTDNRLQSKKDYYEAYGPAVGKYVDYINGSAILVKSTSCFVTLDDAKIEPHNGVLFHTVINSDKMNNLLKPGDADDPRVDNIHVTMKNMTAAGDILHEDYQRKLLLTLENATLTGTVISGTCESWNEKWTDCKDDPKFCWAQDSEWPTPYGVYMTLGQGAKWIVTGESSLNTLTIEEGAELKGTLLADGIETEPKPGTYHNVIVKA